VSLKRDPQNGFVGTIDNAVRGAYIRAELAKGSAGSRFTMPEEAFFRIAGEMIADALGLSDAPPEGAWVVFYSDASETSIHSVHLDEVDALRVSQANGYFMPVKFMKFGEEKS
jgi:hypothetical protein